MSPEVDKPGSTARSELSSAESSKKYRLQLWGRELEVINDVHLAWAALEKVLFPGSEITLAKAEKKSAKGTDSESRSGLQKSRLRRCLGSLWCFRRRKALLPKVESDEKTHPLLQSVKGTTTSSCLDRDPSVPPTGAMRLSRSSSTEGSSSESATAYRPAAPLRWYEVESMTLSDHTHGGSTVENQNDADTQAHRLFLEGNFEVLLQKYRLQRRAPEAPQRRLQTWRRRLAAGVGLGLWRNYAGRRRRAHWNNFSNNVVCSNNFHASDYQIHGQNGNANVSRLASCTEAESGKFDKFDPELGYSYSLAPPTMSTAHAHGASGSGAGYAQVEDETNPRRSDTDTVTHPDTGITTIPLGVNSASTFVPAAVGPTAAGTNSISEFLESTIPDAEVRQAVLDFRTKIHRISKDIDSVTEQQTYLFCRQQMREQMEQQAQGQGLREYKEAESPSEMTAPLQQTITPPTPPQQSQSLTRNTNTPYGVHPFPALSTMFQEASTFLPDDSDEEEDSIRNAALQHSEEASIALADALDV